MAETPASPEPDPSSREEIIRRAGPYLGIGSTFLASVGFCTIGGWWLDGWLGTAPWLTVVGALTGVASGFYLFIKIVLAAKNENRDGPMG